MEFIVSGLRFLIFLFMLCLFARMILSFIIAFSREWRPSGLSLLVTEGVFTITDPPLKALRKVIPPLSLGTVRIDLAFLVLFFGLALTANALGLLL